ncbi:MalM family protein [Vibrio sp. JC009]|uniref:MalM family protein n=1 Tax=Vibrio sp. JC009 TaxID=2912314 RepID=UPI0023AEAE14|nr:MalM family protein [Vibrio sp. JC009]WED24913.1 MalM family protein [Vibrio sp. JC009]
MRKFAVLSLLPLSLLGCSNMTSNENLVADAIVSEQVCCTSLSDFPWIALKKADSFQFEINEAAPVWGFEGGKSYLSAFEFSEYSGVVRLTLRSRMNKGRVFAPSIDLLDGNYEVKKTVSPEEFQVRFSDALLGNRYEMTLKVDTNKTPYMVVYTDAENIGQEITIPHPAKVRAKESGAPMPIATDPKYLFSYTGELDLEFETLSLSGYKSKQKQKSEREASPSKATEVKAQIKPLMDTQNYYHNSIRAAIKANDIPKALSLLDEAKALNVEGAQEAFVKALNNR